MEKTKDNSKTILEYELTTPFDYEGKTYKQLTLDFGSLSGYDALQIEEELEGIGKYTIAPEASKAYQCKMAARAAGISSDIIEALPMQDFNRVTSAARNFLIGQEL